jgi:hypothetical protein
MVTKEQLLIIILFPLWWVLLGMCLTLIYDIMASSLVKLLLVGLSCILITALIVWIASRVLKFLNKQNLNE